MSEISKLNGYDLKDATARENISNLNLTKIRSYDTIQDMKNDSTLVEGQHIKTKGYYEVNDGGCGEYVIVDYNNLIEDYGSIHELNNGLFAILLTDNLINAKQFGVYGDNTHDDYNNLQTAIDFCVSNSLKLFIPKGDYLISDTLEITGCAISGESSTSTILHLNNTDGMLLKQYNKQNICVIENIGFKSDNPNVEIAGITYYKYENGSNIRSRGYKLTNLYFYNLGCAIEIQDAFRNTICDIGINNCFRALFIKNQVVQCSFINIVANNDLNANITSQRFGDVINNSLSIGVQIGARGEVDRPEGIKLLQVCCTNYNIGCYQYDCLYFYANQCEFDLSQGQALVIYSGQGGTTFDGCWLANKSTSTLPIVEFLTSSTETKYSKSLVNCSIFNSSLEENVIGIALGRTNQYLWNINIINCNISNASGCTLSAGISSNRIRQILIDGNSIYGCTNDIDMECTGKSILTNNKCNNLKCVIYAGSTLYATNNIYDTKNVANAGTLVGNLD